MDKSQFLYKDIKNYLSIDDHIIYYVVREIVQVGELSQHA